MVVNFLVWILDLVMVKQAFQPQHRRLFGPGATTLLTPQPVDPSLGNYPCS
jgi:hypothetical protein